VPDIASFAVDDGFAYGVPTGVEVEVGARVRIRVGGRRLRGYVTAVLSELPERELAPIDGVVGSVRSFTEQDLAFLRWVATHYVTPLSTILKRTTPPNVPTGDAPDRVPSRPHRAGEFRSRASRAPHHATVIEELREVAGGASAMVIVPSSVEAVSMAEAIRRACPQTVVLATSDLRDAEVTEAWVEAATRPGTVLVGTREIVLWPVVALERIVVVEDARRVMKSPSTPTLGVREIAIERARRHGLPVTFVSPMPSLDVLASDPRRVDDPGRLWSLVEVVDRREEPPGSGPVMERTAAAIASSAARGESVFVLVPRRRYARAFRCRRCGTLRRCSVCGSGVDPTDACMRCATVAGPCTTCGARTWFGIGAGIGSVVDSLVRRIGEAVGPAGEGRAVTVGTERDLLSSGPVALAVAVDVDAWSLAPTYRAAEDTLRLLARLGQLVVRGRGHRCLVQTADPGQPVVEAFRSGRYEAFQEAELEVRRQSRLPPVGELIAIETSGAPESLEARIGQLETATVLGPARVGDRLRWLVQGTDLAPTRIELRAIVGKLRDAGASVRVDVDPIDL
jgi:primosomal protein N'